MEGRTKNFKYDIVAETEEISKLPKYVNVRIAHDTQDVTGASTRSSRTFLYVAAFTANLATFTSGIIGGWTSPTAPKLQKLEDNPLGRILTPDEIGWVGSLLQLGAVLGPFIAGALSDRIGRKKALLFGNIPFIIGFILTIMADNVYYIFVSRFIGGFCVGITFTAIPMYIGEIAEDEVRGALGTLTQLFYTMGLLFSYTLGPYLSIKTFNAVCIVVPATFLITFGLFIPESPYYCLQKNDRKAAETALMKLRSKKSPNSVQKELDIMKSSVDQAIADRRSFFDIFKSKSLAKGYILCNSLVVFQQFSGINVLLTFAQSIFQEAGVLVAPEICTIIIGIVQVISSACAAALIENKGKRVLLMISAVGMALSQGSLAYFFYLKDDKKDDLSNVSWIPIACLISFIITHCIGFGPIPYAIRGEIFPTNIKAAATTASSSGSSLLSFILIKYFLISIKMIGKSGCFAIFSVSSVLGLIFVYLFLPETTGKSLQEIQDILNGHLSKNDNKSSESFTLEEKTTLSVER